MKDIIKNEDLRAFIQSKIYVIRGIKVMLDRDLADLYGVETRTLNQKVKHNIRRFPPDFMFQMTKGGYRRMEITNCDIQFHQNGTS